MIGFVRALVFLSALLLATAGTAMQLKSSAFVANDLIPAKFTCDGENVSPSLNWSGAPDTTQSYALIVDDPDAPSGTWVHWVAWNIPKESRGLVEKVAKEDSLPDGTKQGHNDWQKTGYGGPCPPSGTHRYFFKVYALDAHLTLPSNATKKDLLKAIHGHEVDNAELVGRYSKKH